MKDVRDYLVGMGIGSLVGYVGSKLLYHSCDLCRMVPYSSNIFDRMFTGLGLVLGALLVYEMKYEQKD